MSNKYYKDFDFYNMKSNEHLHLIENFPTVLQSTGYTCGIACAEMVLSYYGIKVPDELDLASMCHSKEYTGTRLIDIVTALKCWLDLKLCQLMI